MSDAYPLPKNIPQGPQLDASGVAQQMPDLAKRVSSLTTSPNYQALKLPTTGPTSTGSPLLDKIMSGISAFDQTFMKASPAARIAQGVTGLIPGVGGKLEGDIQNTEALRQANPTAATIGKIGGLVGSSLTPSVEAPANIPGIAANAAVTMAPYSVLSGIDKYKETGNVGEAAKSALAAEALGVAGGTALGGAGLAFGKLAKKLHPILNEVDAASYGLVGRDVSKPTMAFAKKMGLNPTGYEAKQGEPQLDKIISLLREQGGRSKAGIEKAATFVTDQYDTINDLYKQSGAQLSDKVPDILSAPIVQTMKGKFNPEDVDSTIQLLVNNVDKRVAAGPKGWTDARMFLNAQIENGIKIAQKAEGGNLSDVMKNSDMGELLQDAASVVKAHMNEQTGHVLSEAGAMGKQVPNLEEVDHIYSAVPSLKETLRRRAGKPMGSFSGGSESTAGLGSAAALGGLIGGPAGVVAGKVIGSTAIAPILKRGVGYATNQVMGRSAQWMDSLLQKLSKMKTTGATGEAARLIGAGLNAPAGGGGIADLGNIISGPTNPTGGTMGGTEQAQAPAPSPASPAPAGAAPIPNAPMGQPAPTPVISPQDQAQQDFQQAGQEPAKIGKWNDSAVEARIDEKYSRYVRQYGQSLTRDQYKQAFINTTHGMDPTLPDTWKAMFDDPATSEKMYNAYMGLQKLGSNVDKTVFSGLNHYTSYYLPLGKRLESSKQFEENEDNAKLVDTLSKMTGQPAKDIDKRLHDIAWNRSLTPKQRKQAVVDMMVNEGGVNAPLLIQMGLWGG